MNDFKKKMKEKIKKYSNKEYLNGYIKKEFLTDDEDADIYLTINDKSELFDSRTSGEQIDLCSEIYEYIEEKSSMLENDIQIELHINGINFDSKEQELIKHIIKEHYAIELYKIQKEYIRCKDKIIALIAFGIVMLGLYISVYNILNIPFIFEVMSFLFSFALWEAFDSLIYTFSDLKKEREAITQNLLINVTF